MPRTKATNLYEWIEHTHLRPPDQNKTPRIPTTTYAIDPQTPLSLIFAAEDISDIVPAKLRAAGITTYGQLENYLATAIHIPGELTRMQRLTDIPGLHEAHQLLVEHAIRSYASRSPTKGTRQ